MFFAGKASMPATPRYFAWGCFRYFWLGARAASALRLEDGLAEQPSLVGIEDFTAALALLWTALRTQ
jgi:hypothetical protein